MLYYIRKYPFSLTVALVVIYLSFFKPPSLSFPLFAGFDKLVHFCMYGGLSGILWLEFLWNHRREKIYFKRGFIGATLCPILFSGVIELCQEYLTHYRGGEWLDFLANSSGVLTATAIAWYGLRRLIMKNEE
ncbi:VanZ family protein [Parabacteroides sp. OttesenSCG-928-G06]|nr:VanZ family protein [Parabacteroides sp. OttesenSCG-928-K15]MDL2282187.1 VanZ family protein [Parabacteroides sp. OttesenSCG-928-G06]